jgi:hypothetical protein
MLSGLAGDRTGARFRTRRDDYPATNNEEAARPGGDPQPSGAPNLLEWSPVTVEAPRQILCGSCSSIFALSARNAPAWRTRGQEPICSRCGYPAKPPDPAEVERYQRWWLERYTVEELLEIGREIGWC